MASRAWLEDPAGAALPDDDALQADACGPTYRYDSNTRLVIEKKEDMRRRGVPSPDLWDAGRVDVRRAGGGAGKLRPRARLSEHGYA